MKSLSQVSYYSVLVKYIQILDKINKEEVKIFNILYRIYIFHLIFIFSLKLIYYHILITNEFIYSALYIREKK